MYGKVIRNVNGNNISTKRTINVIYMIFSRSRNIELPEPLIISETLIEHKNEARFLGVITDESLNWSCHVKAGQSKMSRYIGIMYKIKKFFL